MILCPVDMKPCVDDICHGGSCVRHAFAEPYEVCDLCNKPIDPAGVFGCQCDADDEYPETPDDGGNDA